MSRDMFPDRLAHPPPRQLPFDIDNISAIYLPPPAPTRGHQRSRTAAELPPLFARTQTPSPTRSSAFLPFIRPPSIRSVSPERISVGESAVSSEEPVTKKRPTGAVERLASWFEGSSEPVNITLVPSPRKERSDPISEVGNMENIFSGMHNTRDNLTQRPNPKPTNASTSRFSFFRKSTVSLPHEIPDEDELAHLDIEEALFPHGHPSEFSPAAFKNLQQNAEGTLRRFQQAHIDQKASLKHVTSSKNVQADELEAAQTINEQLKLQLQEMAERATHQERTIADFRAQLAAQRNSLETYQSQQRSIRMVSEEGAVEADSTPRSRYRRKRSSDISTSGESELGSDVSSVISVFSEPLSAAPSQTTSLASPVLKTSTLAFREECPNCHGTNTTEAWDVVNMMRLESTALKQRITQLESAQDDALDFLSGLKLS